MDRLPLRIDARLARVLGAAATEVTLSPDESEKPRLAGALPRPAPVSVSFVLRVHSRTGIPLAYAPVHIARGDRSFETSELMFLGMEGYAHLRPPDVRLVESRLWSRRAFATGEPASAGGAAIGGEARREC